VIRYPQRYQKYSYNYFSTSILIIAYAQPALGIKAAVALLDEAEARLWDNSYI
jgi:hypothetical protein